MPYAVELRPHQIEAANDIDYHFEQGNQNVLAVQPTGSGKTFLKAHYARKCYDRGESCVLIAHRDVLLGQISDALCNFLIPHSFICADTTRRDITNINLKEFGNHFHKETSNIVVVSVATLAARIKKGTISKEFLENVKMWLLDEAHHLTQGSQWGKCVENFPNARGLGVTATPIRGDKKGLGRDFQGYFDVLSCTANMIDLVKSGRLTPMKVYAPTKLDTTGINVTAGGDYNQKKLYERQKKQGGHITGSAIEHYEKFVYGQPTITFAVNIEHGKEVARKFNEAGIPTQFVSSKSSESVRKQAVADLRSGKLWNLVNVDLFGEGFDAPAVAAIFMLRKTESYSLYKQQIGRCLRPSDGKEFGYVFDHVGNVALMLDKFGLLSPYHDPEWTLESYGKSSANDSSDLPKTMDCPLCSYEGPLFDIKDDDGEVIFPGFKQWDGTYKCPDENCSHVFSDEENETVIKKIQEKKGELVELSFEVEQELIKQRDEEIFKPVSELDYGPYARANMSRHVDRQNAITILQHKINKWCNNRYMETGWSSELIRREFEVTFGINIYRSQVLPGPKATKLATKVQNDDIRRSKESSTQRRAV